MENSTPSIADFAALMNRDDFGNGGIWVIILFFALFGFGGFGWNRNGANGEGITEAGLCNAMNFNNLENAVGRLSDQSQNQTMTLGNGICDLGYENLRNYATLSKENAIGQAGIQQTIQNGDYALSNQLSDCCCKTQRAIDSVNFNAAQNTAAINENTTAQVQKVLDALCQGKIEALQGQVQQLQMQSALAGVVRYPQATVYTAGAMPYCAGGYYGGTTFAA